MRVRVSMETKIQMMKALTVCEWGPQQRVHFLVRLFIFCLPVVVLFHFAHFLFCLLQNVFNGDISKCDVPSKCGRHGLGRNCGRLVAFTTIYSFTIFHSICSLFRTPAAARSLFGSFVYYLLSCFASFFVLFVVTGLCVNACNGDISKRDVSINQVWAACSMMYVT